jgi:hypothetical protein
MTPRAISARPYIVASSADMLQSSVEVMDVLATILFAIFGTQLLLEAWKLHKAVGPGESCLPRHAYHVKPSCIE